MRILLLSIAFTLISGCSRLASYEVGISNSSDMGVILLEFPSWIFVRQELRPKNRSASMQMGPFRWSRHSLPDEIDVVWQLAKVENCKDKRNIYGCTFIPIEDKIYKKTIDLRPYKESDVFKNLGKTSHRGWPRTSTAKLKIIFTGEDVEISAQGGSTKIWQ